MTGTSPVTIVAVSGSLKTASVNTGILKAVAALAPEQVRVEIMEGLDGLPYFNPDTNERMQAVINFRQKIKNADAVLFSTPEYAFGVPGVLKNALDWLVFSGELNEKPVAVISVSALYTGGEKAMASLLLTLTALGARMKGHSTLCIGNIKNKLNEKGVITDEQTTQSLQLILNALLKTISAGPSSGI